MKSTSRVIDDVVRKVHGGVYDFKIQPPHRHSVIRCVRRDYGVGIYYTVIQYRALVLVEFDDNTLRYHEFWVWLDLPIEEDNYK
jgi:hypothetical protein